MRFGTTHAFQVPPWTGTTEVFAEELERIRFAEALGYDSVWIPEQHFFNYCACPDALDMIAFVLGQTSRVRVGSAVVNLSLTHPLRFAERASMLDLISDGRVDLVVGRGYQVPQNVAFGVEESATKAMFSEALDVILAAWDGQPHSYEGEHYRFPSVRIFPEPQRRACEVLMHAVGGSTSFTETISRGLPSALALPFAPIEATAKQWVSYVEDLHASDLSEPDVELYLDRAFVLVYTLVAPTAQEARTIGKAPFEWHNATLGSLMKAPPQGVDWQEHYYSPRPAAPVIDDEDWAQRTDSTLLYTDPAGMREQIAVLREAGVRNVVPWHGVGGVAQEHVLRSMELFATEVAAAFR
jgi:alkanesulfonate monooxygenase SsuD/methylene tetrahydromethanopterin reductase-like flavin-dependent oxidoreductase (luciferase family)